MDKLKEYAKDNNVPIIQDGGLDFLVRYIKEKEIKTILEIGTAIGYSALKMAEIATVEKIVTLERDNDLYKQAIINTKSNDKIKLINIDALIYQTDENFDLVFIDGAKAQYGNFLNHFKNNSKCFICDNIDFHGMVENPDLTTNRNTRALVKKIKAFRESVEKDHQYKVDYYPVGDGILVINIIANI